MADYSFDQRGALRHEKCGGQIAVGAELYVISGVGFPTSEEARGCRIVWGPHGIAITRKFGGYRGYFMKCQLEGNFFGSRYTSRRGRCQGHPRRKKRA